MQGGPSSPSFGEGMGTWKSLPFPEKGAKLPLKQPSKKAQGLYLTESPSGLQPLSIHHKLRQEELSLEDSHQPNSQVAVKQ